MVRTGRPPLPPGAKRVAIAHKVAPETQERLRKLAEATGDSQGVLIDKAVAEYRPKPKR
jgi:predicted transcriptional regulator